MANANAPFGFIPIRNASSGPYNDGTQVYAAAAADSTVIRNGDPVTITGAATADGIPYVARSTAGSGNAITGIAVGFRPYGATAWLNYRPASTLYEVLVEVNPFGEYLIQEDSDGGAIAVADIGFNAAIVYGTPGVDGRSAAMIDSSTVANTAALQVRILGISTRVNNAVGNYAVWRVRINNTTETPNAGTTGV
jgi:hypothetical protein